MNQAKLPNALIRETLRDLPDDLPVYIAPWEMKVDDERKIWVSKSATFSYIKSGSLTLLVTKKGESCICDLSNCLDYRWLPTSSPVGSFYPVIQLIGS